MLRGIIRIALGVRISGTNRPASLLLVFSKKLETAFKKYARITKALRYIAMSTTEVSITSNDFNFRFKVGTTQTLAILCLGIAVGIIISNNRNKI